MPRSRDGRLRFRGLIAKPDGSAAFETAREGAAADAAALGADAGRELQAPRRRRFLRAGVTMRLLRHPARARRRAHRRGAARARPRGDGGAAAARRADRDADLGGGPAWRAVVMTSANAARALAAHPRRAELARLPAFTVGAPHRRGGARRRLRRRHVGRRRRARSRAAHRDARRRRARAAALSRRRGPRRRSRRRAGGHGVAVAHRRWSIARSRPRRFHRPSATALAAGEIDGVLHFSRRSAEAYLDCAAAAGIGAAALAPTHYCLSPQVAEPLTAAGAPNILVASRPTRPRCSTWCRRTRRVNHFLRTAKLPPCGSCTMG